MWLKLTVLAAFAFTRSTTTSFDLRGVINGNRMAAVPLGITLATGELDVEGICTQTGMACQNCTHSVTCVPLPGGWLKVPLEACAADTTCNAHLGRCASQPVPECDVTSEKFLHTCEQVGIFPDAYDCRKFHLCSPPEGLPDGRPADHRTALCPRHYGYNPQTAQCSVPLTHGQCINKPVPDCTTIGENGVLPSSSNHYYVCIPKNRVLHPQIFICPHGWHFWGGFCRPEPEDTNTKPKGSAESSEEKSSEEVSTTTEAIETTTAKTEAIKPTTTKIDSFFSTDKATTYAADTFLADKYDLTNYETFDDVGTSHDEFANSFEDNQNDFW